MVLSKNEVDKAWIIYWRKDDLGSQLDVAENGEIAAILRSNYGSKKVCFLLQRLFAERMYTASETLFNRSVHLESTFNPRYIHGVPQTDIEYIMGYYSSTNPELVARRAENISITDEHTLEWQEIDYPHPQQLCKLQGVPNCPESKRDPIVRNMQGFKYN